MGEKRKRLMIASGIILVLLVVSAGLWTGQRWLAQPMRTQFGSPYPPMSTSIPVSSAAASPLLFGTNLSLYDGNDQFLTSTSTRSQLQQMHINIIRMPVRPGLSNVVELKAAQAIRSIGAYAVVSLRGAIDSKALADDTQIIQDMNSVFGHTTVFYEYGNEENLLGIDVNHFIASWNAVVPQLKRIALNGKFIGPVTSQYDQDYLAAFLRSANPRPDEISWHEYTCEDSWADALCIARIDNWTKHISNARQAMMATIGTTLPIMITEWNYAPNAHNNDGKINDSAFMTAWTTRALETLAANHIFASMQYACTNSVYAIIAADSALTAQGQAMQIMYQRLIA